MEDGLNSPHLHSLAGPRAVLFRVLFLLVVAVAVALVVFVVNDEAFHGP